MVIEFEKEPENLEVFKNELDEQLRKRNTYYDDLISGNILQKLHISKLKKMRLLNMQSLRENWEDKIKLQDCQ
jgi:hypothetical protein